MRREKKLSKSGAAPTESYRLRDFERADSVDSRPVAQASAGVQAEIAIVLGRARMSSAEAGKLRSGSLVVLEQETADPVDIFSGGRRVGRGQVVVIDDKFCVRVVELIAAEQAA